ncbi:TPA: hypothetical protein ACPZEF_000920 [Escherichia coli]
MSVKRYEWVACDEHACHCDVVESADGDMVDYEDYTALELKLAESQREFRAADATIENQQMQLQKLAAESSKTSERLQQLIQIISNADNEYCMCGDAMKNHIHGGCGHPTGMFDYHYNQWLESGNKTPATDALLAEVRAQGVDAAIEHLHKKFDRTGHIGVPVMALEWLSKELRKGGAA